MATAVSAVNTDSSGSSTEPSSSTQPSNSSAESSSVSLDSSSAESSSSEVDNSSSETGTSSEDSSSSQIGESSSDSSESSANSSEVTSSKKPVHTGGGGGANFISQDVTTGSNISDFKISLPSSTSQNTSGAEDEYVDSEDHYVAEAERFSGGLDIVAWIAGVIAVLCIGGLVAVNVMFRKNFPNQSGVNKARKKSKSSHNAQRRTKK